MQQSPQYRIEWITVLVPFTGVKYVESVAVPSPEKMARLVQALQVL